jgi:hypothetical protein
VSLARPTLTDVGQKLGVSTGGMEKSPARRKREARARRAEEAAWKARNGPVIVRRIDDQADDEVSQNPQ